MLPNPQSPWAEMGVKGRLREAADFVEAVLSPEVRVLRLWQDIGGQGWGKQEEE